eukprot:10563824-Alexandrium_andersonii.AAC.1
MPGGPELRLLGSKREARRRRVASPASGVHVRVDNVNASPQYEFTEERDGELSAEGPWATAPPTPCGPPTSERMKHHLARYQFKDWRSRLHQGEGECSSTPELPVALAGRSVRLRLPE